MAAPLVFVAALRLLACCADHDDIGPRDRREDVASKTLTVGEVLTCLFTVMVVVSVLDADPIWTVRVAV